MSAVAENHAEGGDDRLVACTALFLISSRVLYSEQGSSGDHSDPRSFRGAVQYVGPWRLVVWSVKCGGLKGLGDGLRSEQSIVSRSGRAGS